MQECKTLMS